MGTTQKPRRLVLFDIDGTLLLGGSLWKDCFLRAIAHYYPNLDFPRVPFSGKTDIQIFREMMQKSGFHESEIDLNLKQVIDLYLKHTRQELLTRAHEVTVLPGVRELLNKLQRHPDIFLGLLTGNVKEGARTKLESVGLHDYFKVGIYGDDHWDRYELPAMILEKVRNEFGHAYQGKEVVIIGDTTHDINCGKSLGIRSIAVGTGKVSTEELLAHNPDYYFHNLSPTFEVLQAILEEI